MGQNNQSTKYIYKYKQWFDSTGITYSLLRPHSPTFLINVRRKTSSILGLSRSCPCCRWENSSFSLSIGWVTYIWLYLWVLFPFLSKARSILLIMERLSPLPIFGSKHPLGTTQFSPILHAMLPFKSQCIHGHKLDLYVKLTSQTSSNLLTIRHHNINPY